MPAINVAKSDTFEIQRQKINQIGSQIFNISAGGSDLQTGNLKLGDGTSTTPSLSFINDSSLGLYRPEESTIGYVSSGRKIADFSQSAVYSFKDFYVQRRSLSTPSLAITSPGQLYDEGTYIGIESTGGTGEGGTVTITVESFIGSVSSAGSGYIPGSYNSVSLLGGNGSDTSVSFVVNELDLTITNAGSAYPPNTYTDIPLVTTSGSGSGGRADIIVTGTTQLNGSITSVGSGYSQGSYSSVQVLNVPTQTFTVTTTSNGSPPPDNLYVINGVTQDTLSLSKGNTYRFDVSDASVAGHPLSFKPVASEGSLDPAYFQIISVGTPGSAGAIVDLVISPLAPDQNFEYYCTAHANMGSTGTVSSGSTGNYGYGADATVDINSSGIVTSFVFDQTGTGYKNTDEVSFSPISAGGTGSGFVFTLSSPTYTSSVTGVTVTDSGTGYLTGDNITVNTSDLGGVGSGVQFTVNNNPTVVEELEFETKGSGYQVGDILTLPVPVTNLSATLNGSVDGVNTTLSTLSTQITVGSTTGIRAGMLVTAREGVSVGALAASTTVQSVDSATQLTLSAAPITDGSALLDFVTTESSTDLTLTSVAGIGSGYLVEKVSGTGILSPGTTVVTVDTQANTLVLSESPTLPGDIVLNFVPPFGYSASSPFQFEVTALGSVTEVAVVEGGDGYSVGDIISVSPAALTQPISYTVSQEDLQELIITSSVANANLEVGDSVSTGFGSVNTLNVSSSTNVDPSGSYSGVSQSSTSGIGTGLTISFVRGLDGSIESVNIDTPGNFYAIGDTVTFPGSSIGGSTPTDNLVVVVGDSSIEQTFEIKSRKTSGGTVDSVLAEYTGLDTSQGTPSSYTLYAAGTSNSIGTVTADGILLNKFSIATPESNTLDLTPDLTLYVGNTYTFDFNSIGGSASFALSSFEGGAWAPSLVENVSTTLTPGNTQITVSDTTGIVAGMEVEFVSGTGALGEGTTVESVDDATTITLSVAPEQLGTGVLNFKGTEYTDGVVRSSGSIQVTITDSTPNLYYYDILNAGKGIEYESGVGSLLTVDPNNPKTFGSGLQITVDDIAINDVLKVDVGEQLTTAKDVVSETLETGTATVNTNLVAPNISGDVAAFATINATTLDFVISTAKFATSSFQINDKLLINGSNGDFSTSGELKTTDQLNVNDITFINGDTISSAANYDLKIQPAFNKVVDIVSTTALSIPVGTTLERPTPPANDGNGYIRFNTTTNQYEGYSEATTSWSSLGGVRDLDGNTTILAEETVGANDNTLWFINDNLNTVRFTKTHQEFVNAKRIRSVNTAAPDYNTWTANTPVALNSYLRYKTNVYRVTTAGTTGSSGSEPTDTSGVEFLNGTAGLTYTTTSAAPLVFEEISLVRFAEGVPLVFDNDLRITKNTISSDVSDITIEPFDEKKVVINATSSLVLPVGDNNQKGSPSRGSVRYNTTDNQFEGFDGTQWGGLGGVKDIDQDTQIKAESAPGQDEDTLYFINASNESARLTTTRLEFDAIDTIVSTNSNTLNVDVSTLTFANQATTLDNSSTTSSFLFSTKDNLDFGLSVGLFNDHLLRLQDSGNIVYNLGFGTGTPNNLTILNSNLTKFELRDVKVSTNKLTLERGVLNSANATIYSISSEASAKVCLTAHNLTTGDKELVEYYVIDDGTDVYFTDYNNVKSGAELVSVVYDIDPLNNVRLTVNLNTALATGDDVIVTLVKTITKR